MGLFLSVFFSFYTKYFKGLIYDTPLYSMTSNICYFRCIYKMDFRDTAKSVRNAFVQLGRQLDQYTRRVSADELLQMAVNIQGSATGMYTFL